jgi:phospholipid/cholesterol/gamma-HCH transport system substrate-binding protein
VPTSTAVGRIAAILALIGAAVVVFLLLFGGGDTYKVTGKFENASQLVTGNTVNVAGVAAGTISDISLADDGQALVEMEVSEEFAPLPQGTHATVRSQSLSGIANRYVDLDLPEAPAEGETEETTIEDGGTIEQVNTTSEVDLDQLFNTLDEETVSSFKSVVKGFARSYDAVGPQANRGFHYLNPFLSTSRRVFSELNSDQADLENLVVQGASLTGALAERSDDLSALVTNVDQAFGAIGSRERELSTAIGLLPDFMRQFNTTAFNLRAALDDVDPLVKASRPVARKLKPFSRKLRRFARDAVPTVKSLDAIVRRPGAANDLIELTELQVPLAEIGVGPVTRNGASREGALPESALALNEGLDELAFFRPYITTEAITGWFDDFSHSGFPDAIGGIGRISTTFNAFTLPTAPPTNIIPCLPGVNPGCLPALPGQIEGALDLFNNRRCPGANEHGSTYTPEETARLTYHGELDCDPAQTLPGP